MSTKQKRFMLSEDEIPKFWYNIQADMKNKPMPPLNPKTKEPLKPEDLYPLFAKELCHQELDMEHAWIEIPETVREYYKYWRSTPLVRAYGLEKALGTPAHIYFKNESVSPIGSHKLNSAIAQAYYCKEEGVSNITTETGAGQWGAALSYAAKIFGLEAEKQMEMAGEYPDIVIGCFGGGSNFGGICFPFMRHTIKEGRPTRFIAAEPASCPKLTRGKFEYDYADEAGYTPLLPMFTLGHKFAPANIHAGGLRFHGAGVIVSQLLKDGLMEAMDLPQLETFECGCLFAQSEGIIPAPESCHAIAAAVREAKKCIETGEEKVILFNLSGHGLIDMASYDQYFAGNLVNYELKDEDIAKNLEEIKDI